jgi:hypothetical protein
MQISISMAMKRPSQRPPFHPRQIPGLRLLHDGFGPHNMFQDSARTQPVTAFEQFAGSITDGSGFGNHASQPSAPSRGKYTADGLYFDGTDDFYVTPTINLTNTDKVTVVVGVRKLNDSAAGIILEFSSDTSLNMGAFALVSSPVNSAAYGFRSRGTEATSLTNIEGFSAPHSAVLTGVGNISGDVARITANNSTATSTADQGTGTYGNYQLFIGRRGGATIPFLGFLRFVAIYDRLLTSAQLQRVQAYANKLTGAY